MSDQLMLFAADATLSNLSLTAAAVLDVEAKDSAGAPRRPTFSITGYTGGPMNVSGFGTPVIVELSGLKAVRERIPILLDHDAGRIIGQGTPTIDASGVRIEGTITGDDADASKVVTHARNGFEWQASIGASIVRHEFLKAGSKATVNGREVSGPLLIVRESRLSETSFVAIGADSQTTAAVAASSSLGTPPKGAPSMFEKWLEAKGFDPAALDDTQKASLQAMYQAEVKAKETPKEEPPKETPKVKATAKLDDLMAEIQAEENRKAKITEMVTAAARERPMMLDEFKRIGDTAIEAKSPVAEVELALLRIRASAPGSFAIHGGQRRGAVEALEAAACVSAGLNNVEKHFSAPILEAAHQHFPEGIGLVEMFLTAAKENGYHGSTSDLKSIVRYAYGQSHIQASGGFSTFSLSGVLSNVANKFLAQGFDAVENTWRQITSFRNARDFKAMTSYALTGDFKYEKVAPTGEIKHATVSELSYTNQVDTYAKMLAISRKDLINDDLGAFTRIASLLGRGAALSLNDVFWTEFLSGVGSFWASGNANLITGGTTVLGDTGLTAATLKFRKQTDPDGNPTSIMPRILLVPPELEITADQLMTSTAVNTGGAATATTVPNNNVWRSKFRVVQSSYLSNSLFTGYSTTAWFLLADPADLPTIETAFLNGRQRPVVEQAETDFNTLGMQWRGYGDFGVALQEHRASVRSAGA